MENVKAWPLGRLLSTSARLLDAQTNRKLLDENLTRAGIAAMEVLNRQGAMTQAKLAKTVRVQAQTIGRTLNRLEAHGFVVRARSPQDRRAILVDLSPKGRKAVKDIISEPMEVSLKSVDVHNLREELISLIAELEANAKRQNIPVDLEFEATVAAAEQRFANKTLVQRNSVDSEYTPFPLSTKKDD